GMDSVGACRLTRATIRPGSTHPPFGFALFYLRGIAPPTIKTSEIYWGAIPWVALQIILVIVVIFWPGSVTYWLDKPVNADPSKIKIEIPPINMPPLDLGPPKFP